MKRISLVFVAFLIGGCTSAVTNRPPDLIAKVEQAVRKDIVKPLEKRASDDFGVAGQIGTIVSKPEIVQCSAYLKGLVDNLNTANDTIDKLEALDTSGLLVSDILKKYFSANLLLQSAQTGQADFEKNFPVQCGQVSSIVNMQIFRAILSGASRGRISPFLSR